jgi:hypothetical protein
VAADFGLVVDVFTTETDAMKWLSTYRGPTGRCGTAFVARSPDFNPRLTGGKVGGKRRNRKCAASFLSIQSRPVRFRPPPALRYPVIGHRVKKRATLRPTPVKVMDSIYGGRSFMPR